MIDTEKIQDRIDTLREVYSYSLEKGMLSASKRTALTLERVALLRQMDKKEPSSAPDYQISPELEREVAFITKCIWETNWIKRDKRCN